MKTAIKTEAPDRELIFNDSSMIDNILYWNGGVMEIQFQDGSVYAYEDVSLPQFGSLAGALSVGKAFLTIRDDLTNYKKVS